MFSFTKMTFEQIVHKKVLLKVTIVHNGKCLASKQKNENALPTGSLHLSIALGCVVEN